MDPESLRPCAVDVPSNAARLSQPGGLSRRHFFEHVSCRWFAYFSNQASWRCFLDLMPQAGPLCPSPGPTNRCVGTLRLFRARYISTDCGSPTRVSLSPLTNGVGVVTFATSFSGDMFQTRSNRRVLLPRRPADPWDAVQGDSLCANNEIQFAMPAPDQAALKRSVIVTSLLDQPSRRRSIPSHTRRSGSAIPRAIRRVQPPP